MTQALASPTNGDLHPLYLIPILSPSLLLRTTTPTSSLRHLGARTPSSTTTKQAICTLQVLISIWGHLSRSQIPQVKAIRQPQSTCTVSTPIYSTRNRFRIPIALHRSNPTRLAPLYIKTPGTSQWKMRVMLWLLQGQTSMMSYLGSRHIWDLQQDTRTTCKHILCRQWKGT